MSTAASQSSPESAAEPAAAGAARRVRPRRNRISHALPALGLGLLVLTFYWIEASLQKTPWVFTDELEWSQLSSSIAATGHAARRGQEFGFQSLYSYLIAPAWWLHSTAASYAAIKYVNAVVMCLAAVPTYLLGRLLVSRRAAVVVAVLAIAIPAMSYATSIIPESLAYPWFALAAWLGARALAKPGVVTVVPAVAVAAVGPLIRQELVILAIALALAAAGLWVLRSVPESGRRFPWGRGALALALLAVFGYAFDRLVIAHFATWQPGKYFNSHTLREGELAAGALAIGLGVLPMIGGLASLYLPERRSEPAYRAFAAYLGSSAVVICVYTAAKATLLLGTSGQTLIEERNLFYLSPLLLLGTALVLESRRIDWRLVLGATAAVLFVVWPAFLQQHGAPYFEAPGLAIVALVNRDFGWTIQDIRVLLVGAAAVSIVLFVLRSRRWVPAAAGALACAWLLTGQIYETSANDDKANQYAAEIPPDRSWIDHATHGAAVTFLGQTIGDANALWLTEFWNRSLHHVASLDGTASGPGPTFVPGLDSSDGLLNESTGDPYTLAGNGVVVAGKIVAQQPSLGLTLYRTPGQWRLVSVVEHLYLDSWATNPIDYTYFPAGGPGELTIHLARAAYRGNTPAGRATITVGTVAFSPGTGPRMGRVLAVQHAVVPNGGASTTTIHVESTPVMVSIVVNPRVPPYADSREPAAQPSFAFRRDS